MIRTTEERLAYLEQQMSDTITALSHFAEAQGEMLRSLHTMRDCIRLAAGMNTGGDPL